MKKIFKIAIFLMLLSANLFAQYSTDWIRPADAMRKPGYDCPGQPGQCNCNWLRNSNTAYTRKYNKFGVLQWEAISASGIASTYERTALGNYR